LTGRTIIGYSVMTGVDILMVSVLLENIGLFKRVILEPGHGGSDGWSVGLEA